MKVRPELIAEIIEAKQAAEIIGLSYPRIRQLLQSGEIPATKFGNVWLVKKSDAENYKKQKERKQRQ